MTWNIALMKCWYTRKVIKKLITQGIFLSMEEENVLEPGGV